MPQDTPTTDDGDPRTALSSVRENCLSAMLATTNHDGSADASYAPFATDGTGAFLVLVSGLAKHTGNLVRTQQASLMLIDDESATAQIFGRRRATFHCRVEPITRDLPAWSAGFDSLHTRHGPIVSMLRDLPDFRLLRLVPQGGQLVLGFGRAYRLVGDRCDEPVPIGPPSRPAEA